MSRDRVSDETASDSDERGPSAADRRRAVRERYANIAAGASSAADGSAGDDCCGDGESASGCRDDGVAVPAEQLGYSESDVDSVAGEADLGLGCGNPTAIADLELGQTVLDLGSGAGFDCFLAAQEVGERGRVIGVDMTPEMVEKARANARENDAHSVEFRLGEIEHLPVADGTVDVVLSNCVVNLSTDKPQVFREAYRALRSGGRLAISDVVQSAPLPDGVRSDLELVASCTGDLATVDELEDMLADAGFVDISVTPKDESREFIREWADDHDPSEYAVSAVIEGRKPES